MTHLLSSFCPPVGTIPDFCTGTGIAAKACLLALKHFKFAECKVNAFCFVNPCLLFVKVFVRQVHYDGLDMNESN